MRTWHALFGGFLLTTLVGCQSMNSSSPSTTDAELSAKQQDYETLLQEWQTLKPGITRLLAIEEELNALLGELERLQGSLASAQQQTAVTAAAPAPISAQANTAKAPAPVSAPAPVIPAASTQRGSYALQVASITEPHLLPSTWKSMVNRSPELLANLEPNFQKIHVKNTDYYRLKVGSFASIHEASRTCSQLKSAGISCLVVDYNGSNFSQLVN